MWLYHLAFVPWEGEMGSTGASGHATGRAQKIQMAMGRNNHLSCVDVSTIEKW